jgi:hypothetical protein
MKYLALALALLFAAPAFAADPSAAPSDLEIANARSAAAEAEVAYLTQVAKRLQAELKAAQDAASKPEAKVSPSLSPKNNLAPAPASK